MPTPSRAFLMEHARVRLVEYYTIIGRALLCVLLVVMPDPFDFICASHGYCDDIL